jgi:hypothetical protein
MLQFCHHAFSKRQNSGQSFDMPTQLALEKKWIVVVDSSQVYLHLSYIHVLFLCRSNAEMSSLLLRLMWMN